MNECDGYYHGKLLAGLIGDGPKSKLSEWERYLVGLLPKRPPDARLQRILETEARERAEWDSRIGWLMQLGDMQEVMSV